jgi:DNA-binding transcriptional LysR family regulator
MTLEQLRIFVTVAERMHVTRAAEDLGITQSGASAAIAALEARYGLPLFHRVGRRIELTEAGQIFLPAAQAVMDQVAAAARSLTELSTLRCGTLSIYASQTVANYWLPVRLTEFRKTFADIKLRVQIGNTMQVAEAVLKGAADLGFAEGPVDEPSLHQTEIAGDRLVLVFAASHPWAAKRKVGKEELATASWIMREKGSGTRQNLEDALRRLAIDPDRMPITLELPSNEAVLAALEDGAGVTVISELVVKGRGNLRSLDLGLEPRAFRILRHRERFQTAAQKAMLAMITASKQMPAAQAVPFAAKPIPFRRALA